MHNIGLVALKPSASRKIT